MKPDKKQLAAINQLALKQFTEDEVAVHQFLAGNMKTSAYYTNFHPSTINKFAHDLESGQVAMSVMHATQSVLPPGRSFAGRVEDNKDRNVYGMFYIPLALDERRISERMDAGTLFDVSMGVKVSRYECSICQNDFRSRACGHWPGMEFNVGTDTKPKMKLCTLTMMGDPNGKMINTKFGPAFPDVGLSEVSPVTDGAIPGASVVPGSFCDVENNKVDFGGGFVLSKVEEGAEAELPVETMQFTSTMVRINATEENEENEMTPEEFAAQLKTFKEEVDAKFTKKEDDFATKLAASVEEVAKAQTALEEMTEKFNTATATADALRSAFADVLVGMRTKLEANAFDGELAKKEFAAMTVEDLTAKYADLGTQIAAKFSSGRKSPVDKDENEAKSPNRLDNLFKI